MSYKNAILTNESSPAEAAAEDIPTPAEEGLAEGGGKPEDVAEGEGGEGERKKAESIDIFLNQSPGAALDQFMNLNLTDQQVSR